MKKYFNFTNAVLFLSALALLYLVVPKANAQGMSCYKREDVVKSMQEKYGESLRAIGIANNGNLLEIHTSEETDTWTILITSPEGISCGMASGFNWNEHRETLPEQLR